MQDEDATNPEAEAPLEEVAPEADETELPEGENPDSEEQPEDDTEEVEHDGQKFRIPKALKPALMMNADYTRKTQEVAEQRKALDSEREQIAQQAQAQREHLKEVAQIMSLDERLEQFGQVNWEQFANDDPVRAQTLWIQYSQLKDQRGTLESKLQQKAQQQAFEAQQATAKRLEEAQQALKRDIPEWSPDLAAKVKAHAISNGLTEQELSGVTDPRFVKFLYKAYRLDQLVEKQRAAARPPARSAEPVPQVGASRTPAAKDMSRMSTEEWMKARNQQVAKRH